MVAAVVCGWIGSRPTRPGRVRMAPWRFMMLLAAAGALLMIVHLVNLLGVTTGLVIIASPTNPSVMSPCSAW